MTDETDKKEQTEETAAASNLTAEETEVSGQTAVSEEAEEETDLLEQTEEDEEDADEEEEEIRPHDPEADEVIKTYTKIKNFWDDDEMGLVSWIRTWIAPTTAELYKMRQPEIQEKIHDYLASLMSEEQYADWNERDVMRPEDIRLRDSTQTELGPINDEVGEKLGDNFLDYLFDNGMQARLRQLENQEARDQAAREEEEQWEAEQEAKRQAHPDRPEMGPDTLVHIAYLLLIVAAVCIVAGIFIPSEAVQSVLIIVGIIVVLAGVITLVIGRIMV